MTLGGNAQFFLSFFFFLFFFLLSFSHTCIDFSVRLSGATHVVPHWVVNKQWSKRDWSLDIWMNGFNGMGEKGEQDVNVGLYLPR